jgi:hypothetical protein
MANFKEFKREVTSYQDQGDNFSYIVISAGKQSNGETMVEYYHIISEDYHDVGPNGTYKLVDEFELSQIINNN